MDRRSFVVAVVGASGVLAGCSSETDETDPEDEGDTTETDGDENSDDVDLPGEVEFERYDVASAETTVDVAVGETLHVYVEGVSGEEEFELEMNRPDGMTITVTDTGSREESVTADESFAGEWGLQAEQTGSDGRLNMVVTVEAA